MSHWIQRLLCSNFSCSISHTQTPPWGLFSPLHLPVLPSAPPFSMMEAQGPCMRAQHENRMQLDPTSVLRFRVAQPGRAHRALQKCFFLPEASFQESVLTFYFIEAGSLLMLLCGALQTGWAVSSPSPHLPISTYLT